MSKFFLSMLAAVLVCTAATAHADQAVSSSALEAMGLSGLTVMSDSEAMSVRGMGYVSSGKKHGVESMAKASGRSWAGVEFDGYGKEADAGSHNNYIAKGKYEASGSNFSEAGLTKTSVLRVDFTDGTFNIETQVHSIHVFAGGYSTAKAF